MKVIGITGGVGSGKSEVLRLMEKEYGCLVIRSDDVAKDLCRKGNAAYIQVVQAFGQKILDAEGEIDRKRLAAEVFQDADKMEQLNACIHPEVYLWLRETILHLKAQGKIQVAVVEAALEKELEEAGVCDAIWYVHASEPVRRKRLKASRGYTDEKIDAMFASQMSEADFRKACSVVIDNNGSLEDVQRQLAGLFGAF